MTWNGKRDVASKEVYTVICSLWTSKLMKCKHQGIKMDWVGLLDWNGQLFMPIIPSEHKNEIRVKFFESFRRLFLTNYLETKKIIIWNVS